MAGQNFPGKLYSMRSGLLPASGNPGDVYYNTDTGETFLVLATGQLWNMAGLLAAGSSPVVGPQGPKGDPGPQGPKGDTVVGFASVSFTIDGDGQVPSTGNWGTVIVPYACTLVSWQIIADQPGSAVMDVQRTSYDSFPNGFASLCGSDLPALSSSQKNQHLTLSQWTTALNQDDVLQFSLNSISTIRKVNLILTVRNTIDAGTF